MILFDNCTDNCIPVNRISVDVQTDDVLAL